MSCQISEEDFNKIYNLYAKELFTIAYGYTKSVNDSEDILQNVFCKYFMKKNHFDSLNNEKYWLIRVTINEAKDLLKSYYHKNVIINDELIVSKADKSSKDEKIVNLSKNIDKLSSKYKDVIILFYYDNLSIKEIAKILGVSESAVKVRLNRARESLRKFMEV